MRNLLISRICFPTRRQTCRSVKIGEYAAGSLSDVKNILDNVDNMMTGTEVLRQWNKLQSSDPNLEFRGDRQDRLEGDGLVDQPDQVMSAEARKSITNDICKNPTPGSHRLETCSLRYDLF